jgi:hypothetical protein
VIGAVFFGALGGGIGHAFAVSLIVLAGVSGATAAVVQLLPRPGFGVPAAAASISQARPRRPAGPRR